MLCFVEGTRIELASVGVKARCVTLTPTLLASARLARARASVSSACLVRFRSSSLVGNGGVEPLARRPLGYNQLGLPLPRTLPMRVGSFGASIACSFGHERHRTHLSRQPHDLGGRASGVQSAVTFSNRWAWNEEGPLSSREAGLVALAGEPENRFLRACLRIATRESGGYGRGRDVESEIRLLLPLDAPTAHRTRHHRQGFRPPLQYRLMG